MRRSPNRMLAVIIGAAFVLIGILGSVATSNAGVGLVATEGGLILGIFEVNVAHNLVHLLLGLVLLAAGIAGRRAAKTLNAIVGTGCLVLGIAGLFLITNSDLNVLAINAPDNVLHFASAVALLAVGLGAEREVRSPVS
ncbi:DUF4383 domain-containing protein [Homoserinibacter sp. YIM 151385]|uniref:DUF4383 domain-containing protein n=1 Tax=Homoserinibacter sp. YIM 151385 TaxID=2985506 RepID=UPI0022F0E492|nr:DUF4383 domain-containing protein [Homoserinibacter sp. YIM 151385]WBU37288.1 DUF4383 domain-containing protein [Homoserinibacter sp. YIM 151385]